MSGLLGTFQSTFQSFIQRAYWRGIPFFVDSEETAKGRKLAIHEYPYRDSGWAEDLGRKQRIFRLSGHMVGDFAPLMQILLDTAFERPGPGLLIHPTLGAQKVSLLTASTAVRKEEMRVIRLELTFLEQGERLFPSVVTNWLNKIIDTVSDALLKYGQEIAIGMSVLGIAAGFLGMLGGGSAGGGRGVTEAYADDCTTSAADPAALQAMSTALAAPDSDTSFGRFAAGSATTPLPPDTTIASLKAQLAGQRAGVQSAAATLATAVAAFDGTVITAPALVGALAALTEAVRATMNDPADQVRVLLSLARFRFMGAYAGTMVANIRDLFSVTCRRVALTSLARAATAYRPRSYNDAVAMRDQIAAAFDVEITAAGDGGNDDSYLALKTLRAAVIADLTQRAAALPLVMTVTLPSPLPSLVVAQRLYHDASRANEVAMEAAVPHPAFLPTRIQVLAL